jgi:hypothetical protein
MAAPASDTDIAREPLSTEATWHAGPERDPQLDPVDPINPANPANPAGPVSEPVVNGGIEKGEPGGISTGLLLAIIAAIVAAGVIWFSLVDFNLMGGPTVN